MTRIASPAQVKFVKSLLTERAHGWDTDRMIAALDAGTVTAQQASDAITRLQGLPRADRPAVAEVELAAGAYRVGDRVIRVYLGQQSGKMLATELVDPAADHRDDAWMYLGAASRFVPADAHRMTVEECEEASAGTADHGWCCVCSRRLDDVKSVARGIGPVCRAKQGGE